MGRGEPCSRCIFSKLAKTIKLERKRWIISEVLRLKDGQEYLSFKNFVIPISSNIFHNDTTSERKAQKLIRHNQFCEHSSPAVKARAPTSSTPKLWSNHEKTTVHHSQLPNNPPNLNFAQTFYFNQTHGRKYNSGLVLQTCNLIKLNATLKDLLQRCGLLPPRCWVHLAEAPLRTLRHYHYTWRGTAGFRGGLQGIGMSH